MREYVPSATPTVNEKGGGRTQSTQKSWLQRSESRCETIITKSHKENPVRIIEIDREPWFVAKDVCDVLKIKNNRQAMSYLDNDEKGVILLMTPWAENKK